jgi:SAM-dependent methyltransferase
VSTYEFWETLDEKSAPGAILTGFKGSPDSMPADARLLELAGRGEAALDFGCGVGRNTRALAARFSRVTAYDFPNMIELLGQLPVNITKTASWSQALAGGPYDVTVASLVFQHIRADDLDSYLSDLRGVTGRLVVYSRTWLDFEGGAVLDALESHFKLLEMGSSVPGHFYARLRPLS